MGSTPGPMSLDSPAGRAVIEVGARVACDEAAFRWGDRPHGWDDSDEDVRESYRETERKKLTAALAVRVPCETCGGTGWVPAAPGSSYITTATGDPCDECHGTGSVSALRVLLDEEGS